MKYNPKIHNRRSVRLKGYDYSQAGLYYITICVQNRECLFGKIVGAHPRGRPKRGRPEKGQPLGQGQPRGLPQRVAPTMQLNDAGKMVKKEWIDIPNRFPQIQLHEFIVMPNHFHAIMEIVGASLVGAQNRADAKNETNSRNRKNTQIDETIPDVENENNQSKGRPQGVAPTRSYPIFLRKSEP